MRSSLLVALALLLAASALQLPFKLDWLYPGSAVGLSTDVVSHKIAVIGAGAGGSSAAFWISKAKSRSGVAVEVDVYERENYVGGRSTTVFPYNDSTYDHVELGASIFVEVNRNLWRATDEFNLSRVNFEDDTGATGFWDGTEFVFTMNESKGLFGWLDNIKALWRYGYKSPTKTKSLVKKMTDKIEDLYSSESPRWSNITDLASELGWSDVIAQTSAEYLDVRGIDRRFSREIVEAATRVNYGQNVDEIHALEGFCSMAANGAAGVKGGNFQIFQNFLARSGANIHLNTTVLSITEKPSGSWSLQTTGSDETKVYNDVIIAAPYHSTGIKIAPSMWTFGTKVIADVPPQPYVHLHVTLLTTTAPHPDPVYFGLKPGAKVPQTVLTTYEGVRKGGKAPEFNSLSYHGPIAPGKDEFVVKIFSEEALSDEWLKTVFDGKVGWIFRKEWDAYPKLPPTTSFPPVVLANGLYYVNAFEPFISTMETETVSSRNIVDLIFRDRFGTNICGKPSQPHASVVVSEGEQVVVKEEAQSKKTEAPTIDDFVLGWDC